MGSGFAIGIGAKLIKLMFESLAKAKIPPRIWNGSAARSLNIPTAASCGGNDQGVRQMPVVRYFAVVGSLLLALLFAADWYLPKPAAEPGRSQAFASGIRINSTVKWPERVVYDTSLPTIVPLASRQLASSAEPAVPGPAAEAAVARAPQDSYALMAEPDLKPAAVAVRKKPRKSPVAKRTGLDRIAAYQPAPMRQSAPAGWGFPAGW